MSESELDEWERTEIMSKSIKKGSFIKQIQNADFAN